MGKQAWQAAEKGFSGCRGRESILHLGLEWRQNRSFGAILDGFSNSKRCAAVMFEFFSSLLRPNGTATTMPGSTTR